jgi:hypothetical protein
VVRTASRDCAVKKALTRIFTTIGRRTFWRRATSGWQAIPAREATSDEVKEIQAQARQLKELVAELMIENRLFKERVLGEGESNT